MDAWLAGLILEVCNGHARVGGIPWNNQFKS